MLIAVILCGNLRIVVECEYIHNVCRS
jgi:hypothetical protein